MTPLFLKTDNLFIKPFEEKYLEAFTEYRSKPEVAKYQSWTSYCYQDAVALFESMNYSSFGKVGRWYQLAIILRKSGELVGDLAVHFTDKEQVEIGYTISPIYQQKNIATEAVSAFLVYVFEELGKHRVIATTDTSNVASYRLLEKLGFRREAHFVKNVFFKGNWCDEYQYALLCSEQKLVQSIY